MVTMLVMHLCMFAHRPDFLVSSESRLLPQFSLKRAMSPLHIAFTNNRTEMAVLLLSEGADFYTMNNVSYVADMVCVHTYMQ